MGLKDWFKHFKVTEYDLNSCSFGDIALETSYKLVALNKAINLIAKSIASAEFITYKNKEKIKADNYYLFNIEPNINQNASEFWIKFVGKLLMDNEVLVIQQNDQLFVADSFNKEPKTLKKCVFTDIVIDELPMVKTFTTEDVIYTKLNNENMKALIDELYASFGQLINKGMEDYKKQRGIRGKLKIDALYSQLFKKKDSNEPDKEKMYDWIEKKFEKYFTAVNSVLPLENGLDFTETNSNMGANVFMHIDEILKGIEAAFDYVAYALDIPKGIMKGDVAELKDQMKNFLTFCVDPLAKIIEREVNRKYYKKQNVLNGTYMKVDTSRVEHINIFDVAGSLDVLMRIGFSHNFLLEKIDEPTIDEDWANDHYITKNYANVKGGDENNGKK